jgi:hypothetical protein
VAVSVSIDKPELQHEYCIVWGHKGDGEKVKLTDKYLEIVHYKRKAYDTIRSMKKKSDSKFSEKIKSLKEIKAMPVIE